MFKKMVPSADERTDRETETEETKCACKIVTWASFVVFSVKEIL